MQISLQLASVLLLALASHVMGTSSCEWQGSAAPSHHGADALAQLTGPVPMITNTTTEFKTVRLYASSSRTTR